MKTGEKDPELLRPRPQVVSDSEEMFKTQTRAEEVAVGAHTEINTHNKQDPDGGTRAPAQSARAATRLSLPWPPQAQSASTVSQSSHETQPSMASAGPEKEPGGLEEGQTLHGKEIRGDVLAQWSCPSSTNRGPKAPVQIQGCHLTSLRQNQLCQLSWWELSGECNPKMVTRSL